MARSPFWTGSVLALLSAAAFGATLPFIQRIAHAMGPFTTASLLYAGAAVASLAPSPKDGRVERSHLLRLIGVAAAGAVVAPVALSWGLQRTGSMSASLVLNFEALFTVLLARALFKEPIGWRVGVAIGLMLTSGALLATQASGNRAVGIAGLLAVVVATLAWAVDNTLTRPLAQLDPVRVVLWKGSIGAAVTLTMALVRQEPPPRWTAAGALLLCGASGYGLSLRLYLLAQRRIGAGRTGSLFAVAPFVGAAIAWLFGERVVGGATLFASVLLAIAIYLHLTEKHGHLHAHEEMDHDHAHRHDDAHHDHAHDPPTVGEHRHPHHHEPQTHAHEHAPEVHHTHRH